MTDPVSDPVSEPASDPASDPVARCQWCSAPLPAADAERCPSCGALLAGAATVEPVLPGVTALDPAAILRARYEAPRPRGRLRSFITGEVAVEVNPSAERDSLAPPPDDVRREMLRLEIEAERARLMGDQVAAKADALESGRFRLAPEPASAPGAPEAFAPESAAAFPEQPVDHGEPGQPG